MANAKIELDYKRKPRKVHFEMNSVINEAKNYHDPVPVPATIDLTESMLLNIDTFFEKFKELDKMPDNEIQNLVVNSYLSVLEVVPKINQDPSYAVKLMAIMNNNRFISTMTNIVSNYPLDYKHRIYCNRIIYDMITFKGEIDSSTKTLLLHLGDTVNMDVFPKIYGALTGINKEIASMICVSAYSSEDININLKRVNLILFNLNKSISLQMMVDIYQYLYHSSITRLFEGVMFDVYSNEDLSIATEIQRETYSMMGLAVLEILNVMPSQDIKAILTSYTYDFGQLRLPVRFSMILSNDYYRINSVIEQLKQENVIVP